MYHSGPALRLLPASLRSYLTWVWLAKPALNPELSTPEAGLPLPQKSFPIQSRHLSPSLLSLPFSEFSLSLHVQVLSLSSDPW